MKRQKFLALILVGAWLSLGAAPNKGTSANKAFDFEFKGMDFRRVVTTLAKLQNKSVIFSRTVEARTIDISLADVTADFALKLILENYGYVSVEKHGILHIVSAQDRSPASNATTIISLNHVLAKEIENNVKSALVNVGSVSVNEQSNTLVVTAPDEATLRVRTLIQELDQPHTQVFIEGKVIETSTTFARQLGLEWGPNLADRSGGISQSSPVGENTVIVGVTNLLGLQARLTAGERNGDLKIISSPKVSTLSGVTADIESTTTYSVRTLAANVVAPTGGAAPAAGLEKVKAGVTMRVTPYIVSKEQVRLALNISKSDPDFSQRIDGIPGISDNTANTSLIVRSGQTASIGGLISHSTSSSKSGIPFLNTLPIIGGIFGSLEKDKTDREVLIFLTPTIYRSDRVEVVDGEDDSRPPVTIGWPTPAGTLPAPPPTTQAAATPTKTPQTADASSDKSAPAAPPEAAAAPTASPSPSVPTAQPLLPPAKPADPGTLLEKIP